jgi:hypothetical protein
LCHLSSRFPDRNIKIKNGTENRLQGESEEGPGQEDKETEGAQLPWSARCQGEKKTGFVSLRFSRNRLDLNVPVDELTDP